MGLNLCVSEGGWGGGLKFIPGPHNIMFCWTGRWPLSTDKMPTVPRADILTLTGLHMLYKPITYWSYSGWQSKTLSRCTTPRPLDMTYSSPNGHLLHPAKLTDLSTLTRETQQSPAWNPWSISVLSPWKLRWWCCGEVLWEWPEQWMGSLRAAFLEQYLPFRPSVL